MSGVPPKGVGAADKVGGVRRRAGPAPRREGGGGARAAANVPGQADQTSFAHFRDEGNGLQMSPATVLTMSFIFIVIVVVLHIVGKFAK